ncbi:MAG TPA: DNA repair protein RadA [Candidatus Saccharimonadales bacterium]|nr:DNA repair protein RadA [Candidatus Saccharimonadales bacterium]
MAKAKKFYSCLNCGAMSTTWSGKCTACGQWNTLVEQEETADFSPTSTKQAELVAIKDIKSDSLKRLKTGIKEFDRVLGGDDPGLVTGSVVLVAGAPGVGKSTMLLQVASHVPDAVYFSAEESLEQLRLRANRLGLAKSDLRLSSERGLSNILASVYREKPPLVVVDSIQTIFDDTLPGTPGSIVQVREACWRLQKFAKETGTTMLIVGHVTKEGMIAGPKVLEHLVDVVLYLEGEKRTGLRILRAEKNRYGSTEEVGIWQLLAAGLKSVEDPGQLFAELITDNLPGRALSVTVEGTRSFIVEIQTLIAKTAFGYPKRASQGVDLNRLNLILAVLENRLNVNLSSYDVYLNVVGGFTLKDTGVDLAVAAAILSGLTKKPINKKTIFVGEIGLLGEVRSAIDRTRREKEAERLGYDISKNIKSLDQLSAAFKK